MIRVRRQQLAQLYAFSDALAVLLAFVASFWLRFHSRLFPSAKGIPSFSAYLSVLPVLLLIQLLVFSYQDFYRLKLRRNRLDDLFRIILNCYFSAFVVLLLFSYLKSYRFVGFELSHVFLLTYAPLAVLLIFECRIAIFRLFKRLFLRREGVSKVLIAGEDALAAMTAANLRRYVHFGIEVVGFLSSQPGPEVVGTYDQLPEVVRAYGITDLFLALPLREYERIMQLIETGNNLYLDMRLVPDVLQLAAIKAGFEHIEGLPVINLGDIPMAGWRALAKRLIDIGGSLCGLLLASPLMLLTALLVKWESPGPVFYVQTRVGLDGRIFRIIKFRTMVRDAEKQTGPVWSPSQDGRVTPLGRLLRKLSLDELPQLFNVLRGDMSLVGPRPERPELVERFKQSLPRYLLRHRVKAGMTGWAQVHGLRGNTPLDKRIEFDIYYIQNWTLMLDLEILFRTFLKFKFIDWNN